MLSQISILPGVIRDMFVQIRKTLLPSTLILLVATLYFASVSPALGAIAAIGFIVMIITTAKFSQNSMDSARKLAKEKERLAEQISDTLSNLLSILAANSEESELKRFEELQQEYDRVLRKAIRSGHTFSYAYAILFGAVSIGLMGVIIKMRKSKSLSDHQMISTVMVLIFVAKSLSGTIVDLRDFIYNIGTLKHIHVNMNHAESGEILKDRLTGYISVKNLLVKKDQFTLNIPTLGIDAQRKVILTGEIGSGKSMLIKTLMKLHPYTGDIVYEGTKGRYNLADVNGISIRRQIGFVPQQPRLFNRSLLENIVYGVPNPVSEQDVKNLMTITGIDQIDKNDLHRLAGKNGDNLSGGQRQIVAMLRLILSDDPIIILDEPTAALDGPTKDQIVALIKKAIEGRTAIIISHDPSVVEAILNSPGGMEVKMADITK